MSEFLQVFFGYIYYSCCICSFFLRGFILDWPIWRTGLCEVFPSVLYVTYEQAAWTYMEPEMRRMFFINIYMLLFYLSGHTRRKEWTYEHRKTVTFVGLDIFLVFSNMLINAVKKGQFLQSPSIHNEMVERQIMRHCQLILSLSFFLVVNSCTWTETCFIPLSCTHFQLWNTYIWFEMWSNQQSPMSPSPPRKPQSL